MANIIIQDNAMMITVIMDHGPMCEEIGHFLRKHLRALADPRTPPTDYYFGN